MMSSSELTESPVWDLRTFEKQLGNTPLEPISLWINGAKHKIHLKMEGENPTGSIKDRTAYGLLQDLEIRGLLRPGTTLVESTSGNLGVALSLLCKIIGHSFIAVVDPKTTPENRAKMSRLGAQIELVERQDKNGGYLLSRLERVRQLCLSSPDYIWPNQYENEANPLIHYTTTAPEIYLQMKERIDALFIAASTGGTLAGIGRYFREVSPMTRVIGVDAHGSVIFGTPAAPRLLTGIGSSRRSSFIHPKMYDEYMQAKDADAFTFCYHLYTKTGLSVGGSSGAVLAACVRYLYHHPEAENVCLPLC